MLVKMFMTGAAIVALAACGSGKSANNSTSNATAPAANSTSTNAAATNATAPSNSAQAPVNAASPATPIAARQVMMGGEEEEDACPGSTRVRTGQTAVVRDAPNASAREIGRLPAGAEVRVCDEQDVSGALWSGIAYGRSSQLPEACAVAVATPSARTVPVPAACRSGWVIAAELEQGAG